MLPKDSNCVNPLVLAFAAPLGALVFAGCVQANAAETLLYSFCHNYHCTDGSLPLGGLVADASGNLYGTTSAGGGGYGTVFKVTPGGTETVLHSFSGGSNDGAKPTAGLIADASGNFYGTTSAGGAYGGGT